MFYNINPVHFILIFFILSYFFFFCISYPFILIRVNVEIRISISQPIFQFCRFSKTGYRFFDRIVSIAIWKIVEIFVERRIRQLK